MVTAPGSIGAQEAPKNRYEKLENRISSSMFTCHPFCPSLVSSDELEAMLRDQNSPSDNKSSPPSLSPPSKHSPNLSTHPGLTGAPIRTPSVFHDPNLDLSHGYQSSQGYPGMSPSPKNFVSSTENPPDVVPTPVNDVQTATPFLSPGLGYDVYWPGWPKDLPSPALVRHL